MPFCRAFQTFYICALLFFCASFSYGQLVVKSGTNLSINAGTQMQIQTAMGVLEIESGANVVNDGVIEFGESNSISEQPGFPVTGAGTEIYRKNYAGPVSAINGGNLGAEITANQTLGFTTITRGHTVRYNGPLPGIKRWFEILPATNSNLDATLNLYYDDTELNANSEIDLKLMSSYDAGATWQQNNGVADTSANYISATSLSSFGLHTAHQPILTALEPLKEERWEVFPNPVQNGFRIKIYASNGGTATIELVSPQGNIVFSSKENITGTGENILFVSTASMANGLYLMRISSPTEQMSKPLVIQH